MQILLRQIDFKFVRGEDCSHFIGAVSVVGDLDWDVLVGLLICLLFLLFLLLFGNASFCGFLLLGGVVVVVVATALRGCC